MEQLDLDLGVHELGHRGGARGEAAARLNRVLWNDPATGVMRHADAGYEIAVQASKRHGLNLPMVK
nr:hypothetical protein [Comamonas testosteroni]